MIRRFLILLAALLAWPIAAQPLQPGRVNAIQPELVIEHPAVPGQAVELAILMRTKPGWHGYWANPGDAGLPMSVEWQLPPGWTVAPLRYPVPTRLTVAGLMNYVFERDYAVLAKLTVPAAARGPVAIAARMRWLACTDEVCVPEQGNVSLTVPVGRGSSDARFDTWRQALPRAIATAQHYRATADGLEVAVPLPAGVALNDPYFFPADDGPVDYAAPQSFRRSGDWLVGELRRGDTPPDAEMRGVLSLGDGRGLEIAATPGPVPDGGRPVGTWQGRAVLFAILGAIAGGILLNLMPCVFPILALKALHLAKSGGAPATARRDALAYTAGAVVGTGALGIALLALRAGGSAAGWAFQLQDPRTIILLLLLATAITLNLLRAFELPVIAGERNPGGSFGTGALAAFVATPCAGPFLGAALGTALLLPPAGAVAVFAALGLGLALPFLLFVCFPQAVRLLPKPGPWMARLQRWLAIPMAATVVACLWLIHRQTGLSGLIVAVIAMVALSVLLVWAGWCQRKGAGHPWVTAAAAAGLAVGAALLAPAPIARGSTVPIGAERWSEAAVARHRAAGRPMFVYFTADWCLSCKVSEAAAIDRDETRRAFKRAKVAVLVGDWTNGDPAITRFLESRGRAAVPMYLWYEPAATTPEELPQVLTPSMLSARAASVRPR